MVNLILVIICIILGLLLQRTRNFPSKGHSALNQFVIYISLPALALIYIPQIKITSSLIYPVLISWIVLFLSLLIIPFFGRIFVWDRKTTGCLLLTAGFGNTSFVGFPIIKALYGSEALQYALLVDQPGSFVAITTAGTIIASVYSTGKTEKRMVIRSILLFPPFITFLLALLMNVTGIQAKGIVLNILEPLGATITPLALVAVGLQLQISPITDENQTPLFCGLTYKLVIAPAVIFLLYGVLLNKSGVMIEVSILEAAMAPMVVGSIIATSHGLNPKLATMMIGLGLPVSLVTIAGWYLILGI